MKTGIYFNFPSWANPHISKDWLRREREALIARGEWDVWEREYGAKRVAGGSNAIFPMFSSEKHVWPHEKVMAEVRQDQKKLLWQVIADPGTATVFGVLFRAINPYTKRVYRLAEIYEKDMRETSTSRILPRIAAMREALFPAWEAHGVEWEQIYDEAASWFAAEIMASFPGEEPWTPTQKATKDKLTGLSLMKDQMLFGLTVVSDRCTNFIKETRGYLRKPDGTIPKGGDHLLDCDRYGNSFASVDLTPEVEPKPVDQENGPRFRTPEQDMEEDDADGDYDMDDF
jgi:hypothetical protein